MPLRTESLSRAARQRNITPIGTLRLLPDNADARPTVGDCGGDVELASLKIDVQPAQRQELPTRSPVLASAVTASPISGSRRRDETSKASTSLLVGANGFLRVDRGLAASFAGLASNKPRFRANSSDRLRMVAQRRTQSVPRPVVLIAAYISSMSCQVNRESRTSPKALPSPSNIDDIVLTAERTVTLVLGDNSINPASTARS